MSIFDDWIASRLGQRLRESAAATMEPIANLPRAMDMSPGERAMNTLGVMTTPIRAVRDTAGLAMEGGQQVAHALGGAALVASAAGDRAAGYRNTSDNQRLTEELILSHGLADPGGAMNAARHSQESGLSFYAGALDLLLDPTNLIGGPGKGLGLRLAAHAGDKAAALRLAGEAPQAIAAARAAGGPLSGLARTGNAVAAADEAFSALTALPFQAVGQLGRAGARRLRGGELLGELAPPDPPKLDLGALAPPQGAPFPPPPPVHLPAQAGAAATLPNEQRVMQLAVLNGATPSAATIQRELGVGMVEAQRLRDVASGRSALPASTIAAPLAPPPAAPASASAGGPLGAVAQAAAPDLAALLTGRPYPTKAAPDLAARVGDYIRGARPEAGAALPPLTEAAPAPALSALPDLPAAPEVGIPAAPLDRQRLVRDTAKGPVTNITAVLKDLHNAIYPNGGARFASRALTGLDPTDFHVNDLVAHPDGNAVEPYLDYLIARVQTDPRAAERLAAINPDMHGAIAALPGYTGDINAHREEVQALFGAGKIGALAPEGSALAEQVGGVAPPPDLAATTTAAALPAATHTGTLDDMRSLILGERDRVGTVYPPNDPAFYQSRANVDPAQVPGMLRQLADEGTLGADRVNGYMVKPGAAKDVAPLAQRLATRAAGEAPADGQLGNIIAGGLSPEAAARLPEAGTPATDLPSLTGAQDAPAAVADVQARGKRAIRDLFSEAADNKLALPAAARSWQSLAGSLGGAATGGIAGYTQGDTPQQRAENAAKGALTGMVVGGTAGMAAPELRNAAQAIAKHVDQMLIPTGWGKDQVATNFAAGVEAMQKDGRISLGNELAANGKPLEYAAWWKPGNVYGQYLRQLAVTAKNDTTDKISGVALRLGLGNNRTERLVPQLRDEMLSNRAAGTPDALPGTVQSLVTRLGYGPGFRPDVGEALETAAIASKPNEYQYMHPLARAAYGAAFSLADFKNYQMGVVGPAIAGAARGVLDPGISAAFQSAQQVTHNPQRLAFFTDSLERGAQAAGQTVIDTLNKAGLDTTPLRRLGVFSPHDVAAVAGQAVPDAVTLYSGLLAHATEVAERTTKWTFGDYGTRTTIEKVLGPIAPFVRWPLKTYPPLAAMAARHPAVAGSLIEAQQQDVKQADREGRPSYLIGTLPLPGTDRRVDPLGALSPVGGEALAPPPTDRPPAKNPVEGAYRTVDDLLSRAGVGLGPQVGIPAYLLGLSGRRPGNLSRASGIEQDLPGPRIDNPVMGAVDDIRGGIGQLAYKVGLPLATSIPGTPLDGRINELVMRDTGHALSDPRNTEVLQALRGGAQNSRSADVARWVAEADADTRGDARNSNLISELLPIALPRENTQREQATVARRSLPYTRDQIALADASEAQAKADYKTRHIIPWLPDPGTATATRAPSAAQMRLENDIVLFGSSAGTYDAASPLAGRYALLDQFARNLGWLKEHEPAAYKREYDRYKQQIMAP